MSEQKCRVCRNFFGNKDGLCSVCYKKEHPIQPDVQVLTQVLSTISQPLEETKEPNPIPQTGPTKCSYCSKKLGPVPFKCKCEYFFCARHRLPEDHDCSFNHREAGMRKLSAENPQVIAAKFTKL